MTVTPSARSPEMSEVILAGVHYVMQDVHTGFPGKIVKWDKDKQTADVQPLVKRITPLDDGNEIAETLPVLPDVPVQFPRGGGAFLSFPLKEGDFVWLKFASYSIDAYMAGDGSVTDPGDFRRFDLSDAVAEVGMAPLGRALKDVDGENLVIGFDGGAQIQITPGGIISLLKTASDFIALASKVDARFDAIEQSLALVYGLLEKHVHAGVTTGPGSSGPSATLATLSAPSGSSTASDKIKAG